ncbi:unnamed protein product [Symbiodinium sp. KB8]|nr:unnamed protein product [Symbiodinium sp. KB8]
MATEATGGIPDERKGLTGKALDEAVYSEKYGQEFYDRDALTFFDEGTKENPICILSEEPDRLVGVSLTDDANIRWFNLTEGEVVRDPITHNYFALRVISPEDVKKSVDAAKEE